MPSPPHARMRRLCTLRYISSLESEDRNRARGRAPDPLRQASRPHHLHRAAASTYASLGPPWLRSKTCRGLRYHRKDWMILAPCRGHRGSRSGLVD